HAIPTFTEGRLPPAFDFRGNSRFLMRKKFTDNGELACPWHHLCLRHRDLHRCVALPARLTFPGSIASDRRERDKEWYRAAHEGKMAHREKKNPENAGRNECRQSLRVRISRGAARAGRALFTQSQSAASSSRGHKKRR